MIILVLVVLLSIVLLANVGLHEGWARDSARLLVLAVNGSMAFFGFWALVGASLGLSDAMAASGLEATGLGEALAEAVGGLGLVALMTAALATLLLLRPVRRVLVGGLTRLGMGSLDVDSPVHTMALVFVLYLLAWVALLLLLSGGIAELAALNGPVLLSDVLLNGVLTVAFAVLGVGLGVRRNWRETLARLGLAWPDVRSVVFGVYTALGALVFLWGVSAVWLFLAPESFNELETSSGLLFSEFDSLSAAVVVALSSAIGEEVLFRGALQPRLGLLPTSVLFAVLHIQYSLSPALLIILGVGLAFGLLRLWRNTTASIIAHFAYNFALLSLASVAPGG